MADHNGPSLLVPIGVEALVVNQADKNGTIWSLGQKNYTGLANFEPLDPPPFVRGNDWPRYGVTLSWALPDGLTRGHVEKPAGSQPENATEIPDGEQPEQPAEDPNGEELEQAAKLVFPHIPNRWLIVRTVLEPQRSHKAWILESDYLGPEGSNLYPDPSNGGRFTRIGRAKALEDWAADREDENPHLTAVGPGDITFAAYLANIDNVLSFNDSLADLRGEAGEELRLGPMSLSYLVVGWYARPEDPSPGWVDPDPLAGWTDKAQWLAIMDRRQWSVGNEQDLSQAVIDALGETKADDRQNYPSRTVCHGMVSGVNWTGLYRGAPQSGPLARRKRADARQRQNQPGASQPGPAETPQIAFGNSAVDALAALMETLLARENEAVDISDLIQALEYDLVAMLNEPGGQTELQQEVHRQWFAAKPGGAAWEVVEPQGEGPPNQDTVNGPARDPAYLAEKERLLADLNQVQRELDAEEQKLQSLQWELYALWWKAKRRPFLTRQANVNLPGAEQLKNLRDVKLGEVNSQLSEVAKKRQAVVDAETLLRRHLGSKPQKPLVLKKGNGPRFYRPADPVVLLYGLQRSARHGEDGRFTGDNSLFVRFSGQTIEALHVPAEGDDPLLSQSDFEAAWSGLVDRAASKPIPAVAQDLWLESQLLDAAEAQRAWLAALPGARGSAGSGSDNSATNNSTAAILARQQMIWHDYRQQGVTIAALTRAAGWRGVRPSPIAVEPWQPPWSPLFFCWRITWYPTDDDPKMALDDWTFNGLDYDWTGRSLIAQEKAVTLRGRTLLTKTATRGLENNLLALLRQVREKVDGATDDEKAAWESQHPAAAALFSEQIEKLAGRIQQKLQAADLLSHPLTGFHDQLMMRDPLQFYEPDDEVIAQAIGQVPRAAPMPYRNGAAAGQSHFYPIRAGHFRLQRLWVVDAFGQVFDPIHERGQTPTSFTPIRGSGLVTAGRKQRSDTQALQLPPRLVQWSRLHFRFVSAGSVAGGATETGDETGPAPAESEAGGEIQSNPVAGWLLPNHIDNSLVVFDADGVALGFLLLAGRAGKAEVRWQKAAASAGAAETPAGITNGHLRAFVEGLLGLEENDKAFVDLMAAIDASLWTTDPLGERKDNLSLLIGRPLALVRASLELQLAHDPAVDQLWSREEAAGRTKGFTAEDVLFPLRLGHAALRHDGTLGYFVDEDYRKLQAVQPRLERQHPDYIQHSDLSLSINRAQTITLLVDPRGSVHARSGLLPTKAIKLPARYVEGPLAQMDITFRVGPVLSEPLQMRMPLPVDIRGGWNWIAHTGVELGQTIEPATPQPRLADTPLTLREGWLKLSDALGQGDENSDMEENS